MNSGIKLGEHAVCSLWAQAEHLGVPCFVAYAFLERDRVIDGDVSGCLMLSIASLGFAGTFTSKRAGLIVC